MSEVALLGGGGLAIEIVDYMRMDGVAPVGYYSPEEDKFLTGILPWLGDERECVDTRLHYVVASGVINIRKKVISFIEANQLNVYSFLSSKSHLSEFARIGQGYFIAPFAAITGNPAIGKFAFINIHSSLSHHSIIGNNLVLGPGARITGRCIIEDNVYLGANSCLLPETTVKEGSDIGLNTFPSNRIAVGPNVSIIGKPGVKIPK